MSGWGELIKQGLKSSTKAMVQKGSTVSTKKIEDGVVQFVEPFSKKVTVQSKDGKIRETVKADEVRVKPIKRRTRAESVFIADEAYSGTPKKIDEFSEADFVGMRDGEIRQKLIDSDLQSYDDLAKAAPGDSDVMKRVRFIGQNQVPGLRKTAQQRREKANKFKKAKQEAAEAKQIKDLEEKRAAQRQGELDEYIKNRRKAPNPNDPAFKGPMGLDMQKFLTARKNYETNSVKPELKNDPTKTFWNRGGSVNTKKKQYRTVINKFSDRMLPGKKRTTRIY
jgi:hypothetical protein